ncbi:unnamed protein product [[Candida] boidinii]|nr:unnamed protein product [[Candida] boidinii]
MGASGAGKTTLLDVLANRVTMGVVYGSILVNGRLRSTSFQRSTGYAQQQDIHLQTSTVREALKFSAYLRRDENISKEEKDEYVEKVINTLEMNSYADAIVGISGEGLNVEQRKRLTIGVELVAKPQLLLFLDEPTSGLDSQTSWSVCQLMRKLANNGQAILSEANPAEWMLDVIGAAPGSHAEKDYHKVWLESPERQIVLQTLNEMEKELVKLPVSELPHADDEFASSYFTQYLVVTKRVLQQYYRTPSYIWSKLLLLVLTSLFNGFTFFNSGTSQQGLQNQMLAVFMFTVNCNSLQSQYLPNYMYQRDIYEVRERPSKTFHWSAFILAQITAEIPWNIFAGTLGFFCWYYPVGLYKNAIASDTVALRGAYTWLSIIGLTIYGCTLGQLCIAGADTMDNAANMASMFFSFSLNFCGVLKYPTGFWQFMYRCSPFTYWIGGILSAALKDTNVVCSSSEFVDVVSPSGVTCGEFSYKPRPYVD